jgi:Leu/Phe-tRNA-protein transferase
MIDCQMATAHLMSLGARLLPRADFIASLERYASLDASEQRFA